MTYSWCQEPKRNYPKKSEMRKFTHLWLTPIQLECQMPKLLVQPFPFKLICMHPCKDIPFGLIFRICSLKMNGSIWLPKTVNILLSLSVRCLLFIWQIIMTRCTKKQQGKDVKKTFVFIFSKTLDFTETWTII